MKTALLLSGGMDSIALAFWKRPTVCLTIDYGQRAAAAEIRASEAFCKVVEIQHELIHVDCRALGSGDLSGSPSLDIAPAPEWWPFRNQFLTTIGAMRAVTLGIKEIWVGSVKNDGFHKDGTSEFYSLMDRLLSFQEGELKVAAPAIDLSTAELIKKSGIQLEVLAWAHSCHTGEFACGKCRGCAKHFNVLKELGYEPY